MELRRGIALVPGHGLWCLNPLLSVCGAFCSLAAITLGLLYSADLFLGIFCALPLLGMALEVPVRKPRGSRLADSDRHLRLALDAAHMVTWELNAASGTITYSGDLERIVRGKDTARYCVFESLVPEVHPEDRDRLTAAVEKALSGAAPLEMEYRVRMLDGKYRWILLKGEVGGPGNKLRGISIDIHERKLLEKQKAVFAVLGRKLSAVSTPLHAARLIVETASEFFDWDAAYVHLYSHSEDKVIPVLTIDRVGTERQEIDPTLEFSEPTPLMRLVFAEGPRLVNRESNPIPLFRFGDMGRPSESLMYVPVKTGGKPVGILSIQSYTRNAYAAEDLKLLENLADYCGGALERIQATQALRETERKLRLFADNTEDVIFAFDMNRQILYANPAVKSLTGYTFEEIQQRGFINWIHQDDQPRMLKHWEDLYHGRGYADEEFRLVTKSGKVKWCSSSWGPIFDESGRQIGVQGCERDVTQRRRLEREVVESATRVQRRIGHELHDDLGQVLTGLALKAKTLEGMVGGEAETLARQITELVSYSIRQTRALARGLDPIHVDSGTLPGALRHLASECSELFHVECAFVSSLEQVVLETEAAVAMYRIAQEALHNAAKHAQPTKIEISLAVEGACLCLSVADDGCGFQAKKTPSGAGLGLHIMQYRAASIGAALFFRSRPGGGTLVLCRLPYRHISPKPTHSNGQPENAGAGNE